jgi:ABC-2 type transport system permease protein
MVLLRYVLDDASSFERIGIPILGVFPFITMFLATSITMLRERTTGTLERLMTLPLAKLDLLAGYALVFGVVAALQATLVSIVGFTWLGLDSSHSPLLIVALAIANGVLGMALGLFVSAFATSEFQVVQFMPAFVLPQLLLCGLFVPRDEMAPLLEAVSWALPLTYAYDALARAASPAPLGSDFTIDVLVIVGATALSLIGGAVTLRRRTD